MPSANASVFYGVALDSGDQIDSDIYEQYAIDPHEFGAEKLLMEELGYSDLNVYRGGYHGDRLYFYSRRVARAFDHGKTTLDPVDLIVTPSETENLRSFCEAAGIENPEPSWILSADYEEGESYDDWEEINEV